MEKDKLSYLNQLLSLVFGLIFIIIFSITKEIGYGLLIIIFMISFKSSVIVRWLKLGYFFYYYEVKGNIPEHDNWDDYITFDMRWFSYFSIIVLIISCVFLQNIYLLALILFPITLIIYSYICKHNLKS